MFHYIFRRLLYILPILLGVNLITFSLFFVLNTPDDIARMHLGDKHTTQEEINVWKKEHHYDQPLFMNHQARGSEQFTATLFYQKSFELFSFDFGISDGGRDISQDISQRMLPSLFIAIPILFFGLTVDISFALLFVFFRATYVELMGIILCISALSISGLFYVIFGQYLFGKILKLVPISGYSGGLDAYKFVLLPIMVGVLSGIGSGVRWYQTIFLEEMSHDYATTAYAKGLSSRLVLFRHVLKNGMIPILTGVVVVIPTLFMGSLILESFFGIPGLGSYTIDAIQSQDFAIVRAMVFLGSLLYIGGLMLTDISYTWVDPRVRLK